MKKTISIILGLTLMLSAFTACTGKQEEPDPSVQPNQTQDVDKTDDPDEISSLIIEELSYEMPDIWTLLSDEKEISKIVFLDRTENEVLFSTQGFKGEGQGFPLTLSLYSLNIADGNIKKLYSFDEEEAYVPSAALTKNGFVAAVSWNLGYSSYEIISFEGENESVLDTLSVAQTIADNSPDICVLSNGNVVVTNGLSSSCEYGFKVYNEHYMRIKTFMIPNEDIGAPGASPDHLVKDGDNDFYYYVIDTTGSVSFYYFNSALEEKEIENSEGFTRFFGKIGGYDLFCKDEYFENYNIKKQTVFALQNGEIKSSLVLDNDCHFYYLLFSDEKTVFVENRKGKICVIGFDPEEKLFCESTNISVNTTDMLLPLGDGRLLMLFPKTEGHKLYSIQAK